MSQRCQKVLTQPKSSVLNLSKLIGLLSLTVQAILPARIHFRYLQQEQIFALRKRGSYIGHVTLKNLASEEAFLRTKNLKLCNGRKIQQQKPQMIIQTDASTKGWRHTARSFDSLQIVKLGEAFSHKCSIITVIEVANHNFHKEIVIFDHLCPNRQQSFSGISLENEWCPQSTILKSANQFGIIYYLIRSQLL